MLIYCITNRLNNKKYVGQTVNSLKVRYAEHCRKNAGAVGKAIRKYGRENFSVEQLDVATNIAELNEKEIYWIARIGTLAPNGYNLCYGGDNTKGYHHKMESRERMSVTKKRARIMQGKNNHFYGKRHTDETRKKMSEKWQSGERFMTEENKEKMRKAHYTKGVRNKTTGEEFTSVKLAAEKYNLKDTHISRVCKGKRKRTGGFEWEYIQ